MRQILKRNPRVKGSQYLLIILVIQTVLIFLTGCGVNMGESRRGGMESERSGAESGLNSVGSTQETMGNPAAEPGDRTVLTAAVLWPGRDILDRVRDYNEESELYFVELKEYSSLDGSTASGDEPLTRLTLDILSGKGPDLVIWGASGYSPSAASGKLMENLYDYMEADEDFIIEDYYENIMEAFELSGELYILPSGFSVETVCGQAEEIGTDRGVTEGWEMSEMIYAFENSPHAQWLTLNNSKGLIFRFLCNGCIGNFVDWETGECSFDTQSFVELLELSDTFPDSLTIEEDFSYFQTLQSGKVFWEPVIVTESWRIANQRICFGDVKILWPGYPVADGEKELGGGVACPYGESFSICKGSSHPEAAWDFIKSYFTEEAQNEVSGIPLLRSVSEERIREALTVEYETVEGSRREKVKYRVIAEGEEPIELICITEEDAEIFRSIIENTHRSYSNDSGMMDIIMEEAEAYFKKGKDAAAVADVIQNRVSMYVSERM